MIDYEEWVGLSERTSKFFSIMTELPQVKKDFLTPIALTSEQFTSLQSIYQKATRKAGFMFNTPLFSKGTILAHKHNIWFITSVYLLNDFDRFLHANLGLRLDFDELAPAPHAEEVLQKYIRYYKGDCETHLHTPLKTKFEGKVYALKVIDEYYAFRGV
jgi:hypothetical protein